MVRTTSGVKRTVVRNRSSSAKRLRVGMGVCGRERRKPHPDVLPQHLIRVACPRSADWLVEYVPRQHLCRTLLLRADGCGGRGWNWQPTGMFRGGNPKHGDFGGQYFVGLDLSTIADAHVRREGRYKVGDRFELRGDGAAGGFTGYIVKTAGWRGIGWQPSMECSNGTALPAGSDQASIVEPSASKYPIPDPGTKVFKCTAVAPTPPGQHPRTGATEPNWALAVNPGDTVPDNEVTWTLLGSVPNTTESAASRLSTVVARRERPARLRSHRTARGQHHPM